MAEIIIGTGMAVPDYVLDNDGVRIRWSELYRALRAPVARITHQGRALEALEEDAAGRLVPVLTANASTYEIIFAVDPSTDGTERLIAAAHADNPCVRMIRFSRRFGQPAATIAGTTCAVRAVSMRPPGRAPGRSLSPQACE